MDEIKDPIFNFEMKQEKSLAKIFQNMAEEVLNKRILKHKILKDMNCNR